MDLERLVGWWRDDRRAERARAGVDLRLRQVERVRALDVAGRHVVPDRDSRDRAVLAQHEPDLGLGDVPGRVRAHPDRRARADGATAGRVLQEELRPLGVVDERVDVARRALLDARVARALVRDSGAPHLGRLERQQELVRMGQRQPIEVERHDVLAVAREDDAFFDSSFLDPVRAAEPQSPHQYTARPPEMSYVAPVENEHSSLASQQTSAATSSGLPMRPIGMRSTM